jgi:uncharacterized protein (TIGR03435 family)
MRIFATALLLIAGSAAYAADGPTFEVASIKATAPQEMGRMMVRMGGSPGRIDWVNVSLRDMIRTAYDVKDYQVSGPDWMNTARFDVDAKYPPDTPTDQRNLMMQALLAERFGLKIHKESKEVQVYNLVAGKNGPKLKKADENASPMILEGPGGPRISDRRVDGPGGPSGGSGGVVGGAIGAARTTAAGAGSGGPGGPGGGRGGMIMMRMEGPGKLVLSGKGMTVQALSEMLARQVGKPVFNQTGIEGMYDIDLEFKPEAGMMGGMNVVRMGGPAPGGHGGGADGPAPDGVEAPSIFTAVQDQLGLKLDPKKGPIETIVVDQVNRTPTEN